jgi:serine acetyltransferase
MNYIVELRKRLFDHTVKIPPIWTILMDLANCIRADVQAAFEKDPAARTWLEVLICYPGIQALATYRVAHILYCHGFFLRPGFSPTLLVG